MKRTFCVTVLLVIVLVLSFPLAAVGAESDATVGGVVSGGSGPLSSVTVQVDYLSKGGLARRTAVVTTGADGSWSYSGKAGDYRLAFSAEGYDGKSETLHMDAKATYVVNPQLTPVPAPTGTITGRITGATGAGMSGYAYFYKQNSDGTWPTSYLLQVATDGTGTYSSGPLPLGVYKVRLFTVHTGVQWYRYASTMESATPVALNTAGQVVTGIDAAYPPPAP